MYSVSSFVVFPSLKEVSVIHISEGVFMGTRLKLKATFFYFVFLQKQSSFFIQKTLCKVSLYRGSGSYEVL